MNQTVHISQEGNVALIEIDNPPVNALAQSVRAGILAALDKAEQDPTIEVIALFGKGKVFIAGADIKEFGNPPQAPILPDVIARLEGSGKAIIAVLHGVALGGGLEVALGCHYRVALKETRLGLPEVKLGLLPGAGGTQRLPRLTGLATAAEWITEGKLVDAQSALEHSLIDDISSAATARDAALTVAQQWNEGTIRLRKTGELPNAPTDELAIEAIRQRLQAQCPELYSPFRILEALEASCTQPLDEGLRYERTLFFDCMDSPQRAGLIHHFFASKGIGKVPGGEPPATLTELQLAGDHPVISALANHSLAQRSTQINPGMDVHYTETSDEKPAGVARVQLVAADADTTESTATFTLVSINEGGLLELVDHQGLPHVQQALLTLLKGARLRVIPSKKRSLYQALRDAVNDAEEAQSALEKAAIEAVQDGLCHLPEDIDVLAIEALGYPNHLGGPHFQATLRD